MTNKSQYLLKFLFGYITVAIFLLPFTVKSQSFIFNNLNTDDGLLSSEVYDIIQDSLGNIWFATEAGISIYDGYEFQTIPTVQELSDNSVLKLFLSPENDIWFSTYNGGLGRFNSNGGITSFNDKLRYHLSSDFIYSMHFGEDSTIRLLSHVGKTLKLKDNKIEKVEKRRFGFLTRSLKIINDNKTLYCVLSPESNSIEKGKYKFIIKNDTINIIHRDFKRSDFDFDYCMIDSSNYFISFNNHIYYIKENQLVWHKEYLKEEQILDIFYDGQKHLFVSNRMKGVKVYDINDFSKPKFEFFSELTISKIFKDKDGAYWFTSVGQGVYTLRSLNYNIVSSTFQKKILSFNFYDNALLYYWYMKGLYTSDDLSNNGNARKINLSSISPTSPIYSIQLYNDTIIALSGTYYPFYDIKFNAYNIPSSKFTSSLSISDYNNNLVEAGASFYRVFDSNLNILYNSPENFHENIKAICQDKSNNLWIGTINGLYLHTDSSPLSYGEIHPIFQSRISCIDNIGDRLLIGTTTNGLILYDLINPLNISESDGIISSHIKSLFVDSNNVWIGTNKGLSRLILNDSHELNFIIENYSLKYGLPSKEIYMINKKDSLIYIATENGIIYFDPTRVKSKGLAPNTFFRDIVLDDKSINIDSIINLNSGQDNITFYYKAISFQNNKDLNYKYTLTGYDNGWITTANRSIRYTDLPPGSYNFKVKATIDGINYGSTSTATIIKEKHFYETLMFRIIITLVLLFVLIFIVQLIIKYNRKIEQRERHRIEAEQKALRLQMNPHFIYNSLGSIQRFVLEQDSYIANEYLTDFANLMRLILESSKSSLVSINDEISAFELYLRLENLRFNNGIESKITISKDLNQENIKIPPLLIQPLIENSIWHGIMNNGGIGKISISFSKHTDNLLLCEIIDNGIGYEKSITNVNKKTNHKSTGLKNIYERISLLSEIFNVKMRMDILELKDNPNYNSGTRVNLYIYYIDESL